MNVKTTDSRLGTLISWDFKGTVDPVGYAVAYWPMGLPEQGFTKQVLGEQSVMLTGLPGGKLFEADVKAYLLSFSGPASQAIRFTSVPLSKWTN